MKILPIAAIAVASFVAGCVVSQSVKDPPRLLIPVVVQNADERIVPVVLANGHGSGFYVGHRLVATAYHVVCDEQYALVDGVPAEIVALDEAADLAILRVERDLGYSFFIRSPRFAEPAWANGFVSLGTGLLDFAQTSGHISSIITDGDGAALYDGGVHFGMSGGPLVGEDGYVIGVVSRSPPAGMAMNVTFLITASSDRLAEMLADVTPDSPALEFPRSE